jgi:hypothetical protein
VWMIEGRDGSRFAVEALAKAFRADLEGDRTIQAGIDGAEDISHATGTEQSLDAVDAELPAHLDVRR